MALLRQKFGESSLVKKVEARCKDMERQLFGLRSLWDKSQKLYTLQRGLGLGATVWTEPKTTGDFVHACA